MVVSKLLPSSHLILALSIASEREDIDVFKFSRPIFEPSSETDRFRLSIINN